MSGDAVEYEDEAGLGDLSNSGDFPAVAHHLDEIRVDGQIPIPKVVVDRLEVPLAFAAVTVDRDNRVAEQVHAFAVAAVIVGTG